MVLGTYIRCQHVELHQVTTVAIDVDRLAEEYASLSDLVKRSEVQKANLNKIIKAELESRGELDDVGHRWLPGNEWIFKLQKNVGKPTFRESEAEEWADELDILDELLTHVVPDPYDVLDEDKLARWVFKHPEYEQKVKSFYQENVTYSLPQPTHKPQIDY